MRRAYSCHRRCYVGELPGKNCAELNATAMQTRYSVILVAMVNIRKLFPTSENDTSREMQESRLR